MSCRAYILALSAIYLFIVLINVDTTHAEGSRKLRLRLKAASDDSTVKLTVLSNIKKRRKAALQIERNDGSGYFILENVTYPRRKEVFFDSFLSEGVHTYRAKLNRKKQKPITSGEHSVEFTQTDDLTPGPLNNYPDSKNTPTPNKPCDAETLPTGVTECPNNFISTAHTILNSQRAAHGLQALTLHPQLNCSTRIHNLYMITAGGLTHEGWYEHIKQAGYQARSAGQNIAWGFTNPTDVMKGWYESPGHRENLLSKSYKDVGVSCVFFNGAMWWSQDFGS